MAREPSETLRDRQSGRRHVARAATRAAISLLALVPTLAAHGEVTPHPGGFWKCRPPGNVAGAFGNEDPVALAGHSHMVTDCALHWSDGHGATYCFASPPSLLMFKDDPDAILGKARAFWRLPHTRK